MAINKGFDLAHDLIESDLPPLGHRMLREYILSKFNFDVEEVKEMGQQKMMGGAE